MGRNQVSIAILILALMLSWNQANSAESSTNPANGTKDLTQIVDVDSFKQELNEIPTAAIINPNALMKAKVKTLDTKYLLLPGDSLAISVYGEPEFTQTEIRVRPDGYATIEPFGELNVAGSSVNDLTNSLSANFKKYLKDPKVSVKVNNMQAAKIYIYGAVQKPGLYQQERVANSATNQTTAPLSIQEPTIASVIRNAGGIGYNADLRHVKVTNNETGKNQTLDLIKLIENGDATQDVYLSSGDSIYVPSMESGAQISDNEFLLLSSSSLAPNDFPVRVIGAVAKPGIYSLGSNSPRLNSAIAASQGYTLDANKKLVTIQRITSQGNISTFFVDPSKNDLILRPNDIITIADKSTSVTRRGFDLVNTIVGPFGRFSDSYNSWAEMFDPTRRYDPNR